MENRCFGNFGDFGFRFFGRFWTSTFFVYVRCKPFSEAFSVFKTPYPTVRPFLTARVQDLGFRKITLWGGKYVNFSRTQKLRTRVDDFSL